MKKLIAFFTVILLVLTSAFANPETESVKNNTTTDTSKESAPTNTTKAQDNSSVITPITVTNTPTSIITGNSIVVSVNGQNITKNQVNATLEELNSDGSGSVYTENDAIDYLIYQILLQKKAEELLAQLSNAQVNYIVLSAVQEIGNAYGITFNSEDQITEFLKSYNGMTIDDFANLIVPQYLIQDYISKNYSDALKSVADYTEEDVVKFYNENKDSFKVKAFVRVAHIYKKAGDTKQADSEAKALMDQIYRQIRLGTLTFEKAALEYSDDKISAQDGGLISGWLQQDSDIGNVRFGSAACKVIFSLDVGQYSPVTVGYMTTGTDAEPVKGYHIFKLVSYRPGALLGLDDIIDPNYPTTTVREYITSTLSQGVNELNYQIAYNKMLQDLKAASDLVYYNR